MDERNEGVFIRTKKIGMYEIIDFVKKNTILIAGAIYEKKEVRLYIGDDNDLHIKASPLTELEFRR